MFLLSSTKTLRFIFKAASSNTYAIGDSGYKPAWNIDNP